VLVSKNGLTVHEVPQAHQDPRIGGLPFGEFCLVCVMITRVITRNLTRYSRPID